MQYFKHSSWGEFRSWIPFFDNKKDGDSSHKRQEEKREDQNKLCSDIIKLYDEQNYYEYLTLCSKWSRKPAIQQPKKTMQLNSASTNITVSIDEVLLSNLKDEKKKKTIQTLYIYPLLGVYGSGSSTRALIEKFIEYYIVYGESFVLMRYNKNTGLPLSFDIIDPLFIQGNYTPNGMNVDIEVVNDDGYFSTLTYKPLKRREDIAIQYVRQPSLAESTIYGNKNKNKLGYYYSVPSNIYIRNDSLANSDISQSLEEISQKANKKSEITEYIYHFKSPNTSSQQLRGASPLMSIQELLPIYDEIYAGLYTQTERSSRLNKLILMCTTANTKGEDKKGNIDVLIGEMQTIVSKNIPIVTNFPMPKDTPYLSLDVGLDPMVMTSLQSIEEYITYKIFESLGLPRKYVSEKGTAFNNATIVKDIFNENTISPILLLIESLNTLMNGVDSIFYEANVNTNAETMKYVIDITSSKIAIQQAAEVIKQLNTSGVVSINEQRDEFGLPQSNEAGANSVEALSKVKTKTTEQLINSKKSTNQSGGKVRTNS